ncbi:unnamed protein product [Linum trigynum]|uniref:AB hydrolase-1 domain-containing protein n=1 Tax=Linum trigynum TaxID=586398 RepID=A0AAV2EU89_9ROSI
MLPLLASAGHNVTAIDLAASGIDPQQIDAVRTFSQYSQPLRDYLASLPPAEKVVLVAHSFGGLAAAQAMEIFPGRISVAVFIAAFMPGPSYSASTLFQEYLNQEGPQLDNRFTYENGPSNPPTTLTFGPNYLLRNLYNLSPIQDWALATTLVRPTRFFDVKEIVLTQSNYGSVKRVFIATDVDFDVPRQFQERIISQTPPDELHQILGSDHVPMASRPLQLQNCLLAIGGRY